MEHTPTLENRAEFERLLRDYRPSDDLLQRFRESRIGVIAGPTGSGKDTIRELLIHNYPEAYQSLLSDTTRPPREYEQGGVHYWFKTESDMLQGFKQGEYLQGAIVHNQQVSGLNAKRLPETGNHRIALPILVVETESELYDMNPEIKTVFLIQPSYDEMIARMQGQRAMSLDELQRRLASAKKELEFALKTERYYCVTTIDPSLTLGYVDAFFRGDERDMEVNQAARHNIQSILLELENR